MQWTSGVVGLLVVGLLVLASTEAVNPAFKVTLTENGTQRE